MNKWVLMLVLLTFTGGAWADPTPAKTTTVGGGIDNPWRSPYKTALTVQRPLDGR